ncbi:hypothetical protein PX74_003755 [Salmonella enterica subsp. enterica]|nr:hypothetical protein [Salmonella enterica subsp. enterica]
MENKPVALCNAKELHARIEMILSSIKDDSLKSKILAEAATALESGDISHLRALFLIALSAQLKEDLFSEKIEKYGLEYDLLGKEYLTEFDNEKAINDLKNTIEEIQRNLKNKIENDNKPKI